jgi:soluble lytic murein transglycosylase
LLVPRLSPCWYFFPLVFVSQLVLAAGDKDFLAAREAYAKGQAQRFEQHAARTPADHPLQPYLHYWRLKSRSPSPEAMADFVGRHADSPLSERMRQDLARYYGQAEDWPNFRAWVAGLAKLDNELLCLSQRAGLAEPGGTAAQAGARLYRTGADLPSACTQLFSELFARGVLQPEDRLLRLRLALEANNLRLARELDGQLADAERMAAHLLADAQRQPEKLVARVSDRRAEREVGLYALGQLAKQDPAQAVLLWESHAPSYAPDEQRYGWGQIALQAARLHLPTALEQFARAGSALTENQQVWRARALLRAGRWAEVYRAIMAMPEAVQGEPVWRYWKGRALKALNAPYPANLIFAPLSREFGYYGLLANEELPARLETRPADYIVSPDDLRFVQEHAGLARALLLRNLDLDIDAGKEWEWAIREFDDHRLLAAAELARREGWYDRAILTAERTREVHSLDLRYLTPYRDLAEAYARQHDLDPAWVYGLMRQESRFVDYARSSAGAQGLMQIMPATARWIARQMGGDRNAHKHLNQPETNIRFGTYYLKRIQADLAGSPVLATAAYNAGPGRARRWQAETPLEGAIYVEGIPFGETREYVKKVLANAMYYSQRLGLPTGRLKDRLGEIPPRPVKLTDPGTDPEA